MKKTKKNLKKGAALLYYLYGIPEKEFEPVSEIGDIQ